MESYLAEITADTAVSVMLSGGKSASSKNISSRPPGDHEGEQPAAPGTGGDRVPVPRGTSTYEPGLAATCSSPTAKVNSPSSPYADITPASRF